ncbi:beta-lactamase/transpeptidase-like protein [Biscogniauxia sp. FL1348]|nr:beta-lactamase/transpeptidase-like protein [Biscogniauxia sp. FL1348]
MAQKVDTLYEEAVASGLLPGVSVIAGDRDGNILYSKSFGRSSLREGTNSPFTADTICAIASMTKLVTAVAVLQCVEDGALSLDQDVSGLIPGMGKHGVITGFENGSAQLAPKSAPVTLRMLLSHTSGQEYDWMNPLLEQWRASRNEQPFSGPTVDDKCSIPLVFTPGTSFGYGAGYDWAGKAVEVATKSTLEEFMRARIWAPLGVEDDFSFFPHTKAGMKERMAEFSTLNEKGEPPAVDFSSYDMLSGTADCLGGGGIYTSANGYYTLLSALLRRDPKLLSPSSFDELFRPQLDERCEQALNDYIYSSEAHAHFLALGIPKSVRKTWSFAGLVAKEPQEGRFGRGTILWSGVPSVEWYIDHEAGTCAVALCQVLPPMHPGILALHEGFQRIVFSELRRT